MMMLLISPLLISLLVQAPSDQEIVQTLEIFYLNPEMRPPSDVVKIENGIAHISLWRDLPPDPNAERVECLGYQWLLTGRGEKMGLGAREVFQKFPELQAIQLEFVELEHKTKSTDGRGKLQKVVDSKPFLTMTVERQAALSMKGELTALKNEFRKNLSACLSMGREIVKTREVKL